MSAEELKRDFHAYLSSKFADPPDNLGAALPKMLLEELRQLQRGQVLDRTDAEFKPRTSIFNGNVKSPARAVVIPTSAADVSHILKFCHKHGLFPSIKAGGYGTAGWSINGDVVVDLSKINDIDIETPSPDGSFVSLRDTPLPDSKGKEKVNPALSSTCTVKRRRSSDPAFEAGLPRNPLVANFLLGDLPPPAIRRRIDPSQEASPDDGSTDAVRASADATEIISAAPAGMHNHLSSAGCLGASESPAASSAVSRTDRPQLLPPPSFSVRSEDPFGYMSAAPGPSSSSSSRPQGGYVQPAYQHQTPSARTGSSASSSRVPLGDSASIAQNPFMAGGSPGSSFMASAATPLHPNAFVTFGSGVKQKDIDLFTAAHPLPATSPSGNVSSVAYHVPLSAHPVGSSVMILGGFGFLSRLHGLSIDSVVEVEMVLADGSIIIVNEKEYPDLWWALRGAGPAFGVVTRYKAIAYPVPVVFAGNLIYNFHAATAASLIKHFRDCVKAAPRELYANVLLTAGPADKGSLVVVQLCYIGAQEKGKEFLQAIASWDGEPCVLNEVSEKSFLHQQDSVAQILRGKVGRQWFIRSALITSLPDEVIHKTVNEFANTPVGCTWLFELAGGAVADAEDTCLPKSQREAGFTIAALHQWELDDDDPLCVTTAEHWIYETLAPVAVGGPYPAFLGRHEHAERVMACYGENWARLCEVKRKYDPHGLFKNTFWPCDAQGNTIEPYSHEPPSP